MTDDNSYDVCAPNCGCPDTGNATNLELMQSCAFLWMVVCRDCQETAVRITPERFAKFVAPLVDVDYTLIQQMIDESIGNIDYASFATIDFVANAIANITFPPSGTTQNEVDNAIAAAIAGLQYLTPDEITDLLQNYYTRVQVNDLIANVQSQVDTLTTDLAALQAQLDACDCDGSGGNGNSFVAPTASFADILSSNCPATSSSVITSQDDNMTYSITSTGGGVVSVTVDNAAETINSFTAPNGSTIVVTVTAADGANEVGGITINYDDGTNTGILSGFQYDITCPTVVTNPPLTSTNPPPVVSDEGTATSLDISGNVSGGDPLLTPSYAINPAVSGVAVDANGVVTMDDTIPAGTYSINVVVTVGTETTTVTIPLEVNAVAVAAGFLTSIATGITDARTQANNDADARVYLGDLSAIGGVQSPTEPSISNGGVDTVVTRTGSPDLYDNSSAVPVGRYITQIADPTNVTRLKVDVITLSETTPTGTNIGFLGSTSADDFYLINATDGQWVNWTGSEVITVGTSVDASTAGSGTFRIMRITVSIEYTDATVITETIDINASATDGSVPL